MAGLQAGCSGRCGPSTPSPKSTRTFSRRPCRGASSPWWPTPSWCCCSCQRRVSQTRDREPLVWAWVSRVSVCAPYAHHHPLCTPTPQPHHKTKPTPPTHTLSLKKRALPGGAPHPRARRRLFARRDHRHRRERERERGGGRDGERENALHAPPRTFLSSLSASSSCLKTPNQPTRKPPTN